MHESPSFNRDKTDARPQFSIMAKTCTLKYNVQKQGGIILDGQTRYEIPIYQRPYAWSEKEIRKFLQDILASFNGGGNERSEPMFIGTMQLTEKKENNIQEIIDGQQRMTTFLLLFQVLQKKFNGQTELDNLSYNWLHTQVNNGEQQLLLDQFLNSSFPFDNESHNLYTRNAALINEVLNEEMSDAATGEPVVWDVAAFVRHLLTDIYFVVIETRAGLTKTLQIFNAINTTGLDLNGGDVFKIRMFEYLRDVKKERDTVFKDISDLYQKIDRANKEAKDTVTNIHEILGIYQFLLIARYDLPATLYSYGADTFFERLFDSILNNGQWPNFTDARKVELSLADISKLIDVRIEWENSWFVTAEDACLYSLSQWSRYGRYRILCVIFRYVYRERADVYPQSLIFYKQLTKLFIVYSCRFLKAVNEIHAFNYLLLQLMLKADPEVVIDTVVKKMDRIGNPEVLRSFTGVLDGGIAYNAKIKNIVCRLSAMLDEEYHTEDVRTIEAIQKRLFESDIDIEHIQPFHDLEPLDRDKIWDEWKDDINGIGNLSILEEKLNRSIGNCRYSEKIIQYRTSQYAIIQQVVIDYPEWNYESCLRRKRKEIEKITNYLFG
ncbi:DUF262 domain-containing protein [Fulvivirgaceae bacterium PWU5]|uniref:DUF262 domain-containing protein n=1 Tax=Dawidia cretensis TaxID=2782350 RepID=A0AAP2E343_9BACT|nr:DUF262 domain-containing protein [Dawidia cretensis]MBT1711189.1 DUF262 domain-containing protein [Dawidia cretensis]